MMISGFMQKFYELENSINNINFKNVFGENKFAFQFDIIGEGEGSFYIEYKDNDIVIKPYNYYDYTACIQASAETLMLLISGKMNIQDAICEEKVTIINRTSKGFKRVLLFFEICFKAGNLYVEYRRISDKNVENATPWDKLRMYIEHSEIDTESKNQLLANLVKFVSKELHILIVGACGCGKSSTINALFNADIAKVGYGVDAQTQVVSGYKQENLFLHDTPGLGESTEKDKEHIKKIKNVLREVDDDGNAIIDVVLVIVDGSHRDMRSSFELINNVIIPNMQDKKRILVGINRCDLALDGRGWIHQYNYPNEELLSRLKEKAESVKRRIKEDTGVDVEPVFYSALYKYNISKLLSYLVKSAPVTKRVFFAEKINSNRDNFFRDDTVSVIKKSKQKSGRNNRGGFEGYNTKEWHDEVSSINYKVGEIERRIEKISEDLSTNRNGKNAKTEKYSVDNKENEYEFISQREKTYAEEFEEAMEESFQSASNEISENCKDKVKISFTGILDSMRQGATSGAALGKVIGENIPVIGAAIGSAVGVVLGGVGGFFSGIFGKKR